MQGTPEHPKAPLGNNFRPPQPLLHRPVRTNIDFRAKQNGKLCPSMYRDLHYRGTFDNALLLFIENREAKLSDFIFCVIRWFTITTNVNSKNFRLVVAPHLIEDN